MSVVEPSAPARQRPRRLILIGTIVLAFVAVVLGIVIAGPSALERIDAGSGGIPISDGFPADFPVYGSASLQSSGWDSATSSGFAEWLSTDSPKQLVAYYNAALAKGDWEDKPSDLAAAKPQILFRRSSQRTYGGTLSFQTNALNGVTRIDLEMGPNYWKPVPTPSSVAAS
jgi:hypothetical protein